MATITLTEDRLISTIMPSGGGSLASGDTIQLAGHSLIVDTDAVSYPVTIANSGADANLELRDLGRIKLNATLPATVHPWVDPEHPLPVSAEPGIDGDLFRTNLTANARAEIQLNGNFSLGGGAASLPTDVRPGGFWAEASNASGNQVLFPGNDFSPHVGDYLISLRDFEDCCWYRVTGWDSSTKIATVHKNFTKTSNGVFGLAAGGVAIVCLGTSAQTNGYITSDISGGSVMCIGNNTSNGVAFYCIKNSSVLLDRFAFAPNGVPIDYSTSVVTNSSISIKQLVSAWFFSNLNTGLGPVVADIGEIACMCINRTDGGTIEQSKISIGGGFVRGNFAQSTKTIGVGITAINTRIGTFSVPSGAFGAMAFENITTSEIDNATLLVEQSGTVTKTEFGWYHAPATATDVTWRYADRTVAPGATLRLRCAWLREGSDATRASVAVTDPATWWPQLWPLGAEALASVEFTGGTAEWLQELLTWRNTSTEAATVRVWECVTGTTAGGYLKVEEVKGGAL